MSSAGPAPSDADGSHGLAGLWSTLAGGRRAAPGAPEDGGPRRGRAFTRTGADARRRRRDVEAELIGLRQDPTSEPAWWCTSWEQGLDEELPADRLFDDLGRIDPTVRVLHGLHVVGTTTVIDHVLVGTGGVVVADTETCPGRVRTDGVHLRVRGRDRSPLVDVALWQAEAVRAALAVRGFGHVPVHGVLHWQHVEGLGDRGICLRGVPLLSAGGILGLATKGRTVSPLAVERIASALAPATQQH
jgi:hypothetical protein